MVNWTIDVVHSDYPAAASTRAITVGGQMCQCAQSSTAGQYPNTTVDATKLHPQGKGPPWNGPRNTPPIPGRPWEVLAPVPAQGPKARYRGAALWRVTAPSPQISLPAIRGGGWECGQTSPLGAYFMRPVCRMRCNDPAHLAVDVGLEANAKD